MKQFDLVYFLCRFYGINSPLLNNKKLSHEDIETLLPDIRTCPIRDVSKEEIYNGNLIMVYDKNNIIKYYYNPHLDIDYDYNYEEADEKEDIININVDDLNDLSKDELLRYRRKIKYYGLKKMYKILTKIIREKKRLEPKYYREETEKIKIKESYYD